MTTASFLRRLLRRSPPAPEQKGKDPLVCRPPFLPRASVVCTCLRRRGPPLGFFIDHVGDSITFEPAPGAPYRLPRGLFSLELDGCYMTLGWRHGLGLFFHKIRFEVLVWDPVAGHQHLLAVPPDFEFQGAKGDISGAVLRAAGDVGHFRVVLVGSNGKQPRTGLACVYSSETGVWGDCVSTPLPSEGLFIFRSNPAVLAGDCLHWSLTMAGSRSILKFDLNRKSLDLRLLPGDYYTPLSPVKCAVMRAEGGEMGFLFLYGFIAQLWSLKPYRDGVEIWTPGRSIELDKLLGLNPEKDPPQVIGYAEENNVVFFWTVVGVFMVHLESWRFNKLSKTSIHSWYHPFEIAYTPGIAGGHDGAKVVTCEPLVDDTMGTTTHKTIVQLDMLL
ncbi:uncharacterized protein LOC119345612 [Triticum dicoccoides]|uniref:uncharacterized protein LOC119345043 n=1 Tax=Triticum dicoccoides TaxID=85692 RepID=UPI00188E6F90|nr:uncharacterized protein LOC119345043 [Triticum dicoccoides]XP_037471513.1 uncharacterized protein LOC119345612 [Triticum dicoccoides]